MWEVDELDIQRKLLYVHPIAGKMEVSWPGDAGEIHTKILQRMREVLREDTVYPYLKENAAHRLAVARHLARNTGICDRSLLHIGGSSWCLFPWLGTRGFRTLRRILTANARELGISGIEYDGCCYLKFHLEGDGRRFVKQLAGIAQRGVQAQTLVFPSEMPVFDKFDALLPPALLRSAYATDRLSPEEAVQCVAALAREL